jgi:periplasmic protein TonB
MLASDVLELGNRRWPNWALCGAIALLLHAGGAVWAIYTPPHDEIDDEVAGAIAMELAPAVAMQRVETPDATVGPQTEDAVPTPPTTEKVDELKPLDIPQFEQSPLAPDPEVALPIAKPIDETPPKEEELKEVQPENLAPQQTAAAQAMAPPQLAAKEATDVTAPQIGEAAKDSQAVLTFQKFIRLHVKKHQSYPGEARDRNEQGTAVVEFAIDRTGRLIDRRLRSSSGYAKLDEEALATLDRCNPFPLPPDEQPGEVIRFSLQIQFKIK